MLRRLLRRGPGVGDDVRVLVGPFAGHTARITERQPDGRFLVVIDECCTPLVATTDLQLVKRNGFADQLGNIHRKIEQNAETDIIRGQAAAAQRPGADGGGNLGPF